MALRKKDRLDPRPVTIGGKRFWRVELGSEIRNGKRHRLRKTFACHDEAKTFAQLRKIERTNRGTYGVMLSDRLRGEAVEADRLLAPYGVSILELARQYVLKMEQSQRSETVNNAVAQLLTAKVGDGLRRRYVLDLRSRLHRFAADFGTRKCSDITPAEIDRWLRALALAPLTRNTFRMRLSVLFQFAKQQGWVPTNPLADVPTARVTPNVPGILTPEQAARLLESASTETLPAFAIGLFAGLRSAEIARLEWKHIRWEERLVEVPALSSKTASRRLVTMAPNLIAWLEPYRGERGKIVPPNHVPRMVLDKKRAGIVDWPSNGARHSFASYHLAKNKDAPALSLELGHVRPQTVFAHYRELVTPAEAERFWRIVPAIDAQQKLSAVA
jgi:integrase